MINKVEIGTVTFTIDYDKNIIYSDVMNSSITFNEVRILFNIILKEYD